MSSLLTQIGRAPDASKRTRRAISELNNFQQALGALTIIAGQNFGTATFGAVTGGSGVTVNSTAITAANSIVITGRVTNTISGGAAPGQIYVSSITAGVSFKLFTQVSGDTSTIWWWVISHT